MEKELDKETCIDMLSKLIFEYGQEEFYFMSLKNKFVRILEKDHMNTVLKLIDRSNRHLIVRNPESWNTFSQLSLITRI